MSLTSTTAAASDQTNHQPRTRSKATKGTSRQKAEVAAATEKRSWYVSPEASKRLAIHAAMESRSQSDIVNELLEGLNRFTLPAANTRATKGSQSSSDTGENRQDGSTA